MRSKLFLVLTIVALATAGWQVALAAPANDTATCSVSVTVDDIMEWSGNFTAIALSNITAQATVVSDTATTTLYTNGNASISADNTATAQLSTGSADTLVTEYSLAFDGDGTTATGGASVAWTAYDSFLSVASSVTHVANDGAVDVTLGARASNASGTLADAGAYSATQTLTAAWAG